MDVRVYVIHQRLHGFGWSVNEASFATLDGGELWVVSGRRGNQTFSVQGDTQRDAWRDAWRLARRLEGNRLKVRVGTPPRYRPAGRAKVA
jgi:hypothetical protein